MGGRVSVHEKEGGKHDKNIVESREKEGERERETERGKEGGRERGGAKICIFIDDRNMQKYFSGDLEK